MQPKPFIHKNDRRQIDDPSVFSTTEQHLGRLLLGDGVQNHGRASQPVQGAIEDPLVVAIYVSDSLLGTLTNNIF